MQLHKDNLKKEDKTKQTKNQEKQTNKETEQLSHSCVGNSSTAFPERTSHLRPHSRNNLCQVPNVQLLLLTSFSFPIYLSLQDGITGKH